jgi:hypothetical protein
LRRLVLLVGILLAFVGVQSALAQVGPQEHQVKAAFLFKFLTFVEWPPEAFSRSDSPYVIGVLGGEDVVSELRQLVPGRPVNGRPVAVRRLQPGEPLSGVHAVFVARNESARLPVIVKVAQSQPLLIVTELDGALEEGSVINFLVADGRVRFEVALDSAERSKLRISSRMLAVAQNVRPAKP